jgi:hypothetical protein
MKLLAYLWLMIESGRCIRLGEGGACVRRRRRRRRLGPDRSRAGPFEMEDAQVTSVTKLKNIGSLS